LARCPFNHLRDTKELHTITVTIIVAIVFGQLIEFGVGAAWHSEMFTATALQAPRSDSR
jgi:hypothetical protein